MAKETFQNIKVVLTDETEMLFYGMIKHDEQMLFVVQKESDGKHMYDIFKAYGFPVCNIKMFVTEEKK